MALGKNERWLACDGGYVVSGEELYLHSMFGWVDTDRHESPLPPCIGDLLPSDARLAPGEGPIKVRVEITKVED